MKMFTLAKRNAIEIIRDPLSIAFGIGFPIVLILLLSTIQKNIPVSLFEINYLTPGITVFGLSFMTLFSATVIAKDRSTSFLQRLYTTPLTAKDFILGYTLPIIPLSVLQSLICYTFALIYGLDFSANTLIAILLIIPISIMFISLGLLCGSMFTDKQVGGICGALLTNLTAWLSGVWFDLELAGGFLKKIAQLLPFYHAVELERAAQAGNFKGILPHLAIVFLYDIVILFLAIFMFVRQMKKQ